MPADVVVIEGSVPGGEGFLESFSRELGASAVKPTYKRFPDGEAYVRLPGGTLRGARVAVVVQSIAPPQDSSLVTAMLLADAAKRAGFERVVLVAPYIAYARQDRVFLEGEPVSLDVVFKALYHSGFDELYTVEIHSRGSESRFPGRSRSVSPFRSLAALVEGRRAVVIAPDRGALERARELAEAAGLDYDYLEKHRDRVTGEVTVKPKTLDVDGMDAVLVDDIISTGGTIAKAARTLREQGARRVYVIVAHALLVGGAQDRLRESGVSRVYSCNTLPPVGGGLVEYVDVGGLVASEVKRSIGVA